MIMIWWHPACQNNLVDFDTPIHVVRGFQGDNLDELQQNLKTKKMIGVDEDGGVEIKTVDVPYEARKIKLEIDEKNIYRFGMGLNLSGLKDTSATIQYCDQSGIFPAWFESQQEEIKLKQLFRKILKIVLDEINEKNDTKYQQSDVFFEFKHEVMSNSQENADICLTEAQTKQAKINTLLDVAAYMDDETIIKSICDVLDIEYDEIKGKLPDVNEADKAITAVQNALIGVSDNGQAAERNSTNLSW